MDELFNVSMFENAGAEPDLLDEVMTEGEAEFDTKDPSVTPQGHIDPAGSGEHPIPVPDGGVKDKSKNEGPTPKGGISDTPAKAYDTTTLPNPSSVTLTASQYNQALEQLQKSFKEGAELAGMLAKVKVVEEETATAEEINAMNLLSEMVETKPQQLTAWLESTFGVTVDEGKLQEITEKKKAKKKDPEEDEEEKEIKEEGNDE